jgi:hypothetical protein
MAMPLLIFLNLVSWATPIVHAGAAGTMNNEQIKATLRALRWTEHDFTVILSGKRSRKVHGLYKPDSREIIIHNRNFTSDNELMYTAIHEYAHHIQFTTSATPLSARTHTTAFWNLFHTLLIMAEEKGLYRNPFDGIDELRELTRRIREKFLSAGGLMMKELGSLLIQANGICEKHGASFSDYLDRVLSLPRNSAQLIMKTHTLDIDPRVGFENMRSLTSIRDDGERRKAQEELLGGHSPDMVKAKYTERPTPRDPRQALMKERDRLERMIHRLRNRLEEIEKRIAAIGKE